MKKTLLLFLFLGLLTNGYLFSQNNALHFDGTNDYVDLGTSDTPSFINGISITGFIKWDKFNSWSRLIDLGNGPASDNILITNSEESSVITLSIWKGNVETKLNSSISLNADQWYYLAATVSATGEANLYVDGVIVGTATGFNIPNSLVRNNQYIGKSNWAPDAYFNGCIDNVSIWNKELSQSEIIEGEIGFTGTESGLLHYYDFNQGVAEDDNSTVTTLVDKVTTNPKNGTLNNFSLSAGSISNWVAGYGRPVEIETLPVTAIGYTSATGNGNITDLGLPNPTQHGIVWSTTTNPTIALATKTELGAATSTGEFSSIIPSLESETTYYVRAYAVTSTDTIYGNEVSFSTQAFILENHALHFDGENDYIAIPQLGTGLNTFTFEAWIFPEPGTGKRILYSTDAWTNGSIRISISDASQLILEVGGLGYIYYMNGLLAYNQWQHIAVTYNANTKIIMFYYNGVENGGYYVSQYFSIPQANLTAAGLGSNNGTQFYKGRIDEVRIWNVERTVSDISTNRFTKYTGIESGLLALYNFDQGIAQGNNSTVTSLFDAIASNPKNGTLIDFSLQPGATSNWVNSFSSNTLEILPITTINYTSATGIGRIVELGIPNTTQHGVVWNTSPNPTVDLVTKTEQGAISATGTFEFSITGLEAETTYYARVYTTNSYGTSYSNQVIFATQNNALHFDGVDDRVTIPEIGTSLPSFTFEAWIKPETNSGIHGLFATNTWEIGNVHLNIENNKLVLNVRGNEGVTIWINGVPQTQPTPFMITPLTPNVWQHVAVVYDGINYQIKFYYNGIESGVYPSNLTNFLPLADFTTASLGSWNAERFYNGKMDEVRIWNGVRTATEINTNKDSELTGTENGLIAYYNFNQGVANEDNTIITTLTDRVTPNQKNGTLINFSLQSGITSNWTNGFIPPTKIETLPSTTISKTSATGNGTIVSIGETAIIQHGFVWSTSPNPDTLLTTKSKLGAVASVGTFSSTITGLEKGTKYYIRAYAVDAAEVCYGNDMEFTTLADVPDSPANISAVAGIASAVVSFSVPQNNGSEITSYRVTSFPELLEANGTSSPITINGLTNGTAYFFMVTATNAIGMSEPSLPSNMVTPFADTEKPVISGMPENITVNTDEGKNYTSVSWTEPTATDNVSVISFNSDYTAGSQFQAGITTVTYTATDAANNVQTASFTITVNDPENPVISGIPENITVNTDEGKNYATVSWTEPTAIDNVEVVSFSSDHSNGSQFDIGTTTVIYTATDEANNFQAASFTITVNDSENPVISSMPEDITVNTNEGKDYATVSWTEPTANDNVGVVSFSSDYTSGSQYQVGTTTVTYTATDEANNTETASFTITVNNSTGIPNGNKNNLLVYPNPVKDILNISSGNINDNGTFTIFSVIGKIIVMGNITKGQTVVNTENLNSGIYLLYIQTNNTKNTFKIFKE